jgi:hypothetical protein
MTANELADEIEDYEYEIGVKFSKTIGTMLRQQETTIERYYQMLRDKDVEITMLKQIIDANNLMSDIGQFKKESEK